jgi:hypothetical protein
VASSARMPGRGFDKDRADHTAYCGGWEVGRIYQTRRGGFEQHGGSFPWPLFRQARLHRKRDSTCG